MKVGSKVTIRPSHVTWLKDHLIDLYKVGDRKGIGQDCARYLASDALLIAGAKYKARIVGYGADKSIFKVLVRFSKDIAVHHYHSKAELKVVK
jgi:hypothetical protein